MCLGMVSPTVGWDLLQKSSVNKRVDVRAGDVDNRSPFSSSAKVTEDSQYVGGTRGEGCQGR